MCPTGRRGARVLHDKRKLSERGPTVTAGAAPQTEGCAGPSVMPRRWPAAALTLCRAPGRRTRKTRSPRLLLVAEEAASRTGGGRACWQRVTAPAWLGGASGRPLGCDPRCNLHALPGRRAACCLLRCPPSGVSALTSQPRFQQSRSLSRLLHFQLTTKRTCFCTIETF